MRKRKDLVKSIVHVLTRKPIPRGQLCLFKALYEAGSRGLSKEDLAERMRWGNEKSLTGVIGALGKRVNGTWDFEIAKPGAELLVVSFNGKRNGTVFYRIRPELREAIKALPELSTALNLDYKDIHKWFADKKNALSVTPLTPKEPSKWTPKTLENHIQGAGRRVDIPRSRGWELQEERLLVEAAKSRFFDAKLTRMGRWVTPLRPEQVRIRRKGRGAACRADRDQEEAQPAGYRASNRGV
jgi:hypothetical protein